MQTIGDFTYLQHPQIDIAKWDDCIAHSPAGSIYGQGFYLNNMCPNWSALCGPKYDWVMPLTWRKKWGISYLYQPAFTQQLGVFARSKEVAIPWEAILPFLKKEFRFWEISFNHSNTNFPSNNNLKVTTGTNLILPLSNTYNAVSQQYHGDLKRNLSISKKSRFTYQVEHNYNTAISLYQQQYGDRFNHVSKTDYTAFAQLVFEADKRWQIECRTVNDDKNNIQAIALLLRDEKRLYNMMNTTTPDGRKTKANHFLFDEIIREFAGQDLILDFEGSDLPGVKSFYLNFGSINQPFSMVKYNGLAWPLRLLKK